MDENSKVNGEGQVPSGFDEALNVTPKPQSTFNPTPMFSGFMEQKKEGFSVTPEGSFYTDQQAANPQSSAPPLPDATPESKEPAEVSSALKEDMSKSEAATAGETTADSTTAEAPPVKAEKAPAAKPILNTESPATKPDFIPSGTYSYSAPANATPPAASENLNMYSGAYNQNADYQTPLAPSNKKEQKKAEKAAKKDKKKKYGLGVLLTAIILSIVLAVGGSFGGMLAYNHFFGKADQKDTVINKDSNVVQQEVTNITVEDETVYSVVEAVAKKSGPSVVGIRTTAAVSNFFGGLSEAAEEGSGIIYTTDGYIITNYHVIQSAVESSNSKIEVFLPSDIKSAIPATVVGYNISYDLAVVKIEKTGLPAIELADSDKLTVGQYAIAIGNPGGLEFIGSVSCGVISGLNRSVTVGTGSTMSLIQTDAAINPGNSGGALVNAEGKLIGVNSAKLVSESFEGMGFSIPSNTAQEICDNIIKKQNEPTPYIGIQISQSYTAADLKGLGLPAGAVVISVVEGGPAYDSGIQRGDIITEFNGTAINNYTDLDGAMQGCTPGTSVTVKIYRAGRSYSTNINVEANNAG